MKTVYIYILVNPLNPDFTIVTFNHYKPRIAAAILDLWWMKMTYSGWQIKKYIFKQFQENFPYKSPRCRKLSNFSEIKNYAVMHRED